MESGLRILVADDNDLMRFMLDRVLRQMGHTCDLAENGAEALDRAFASRYDLIVTDLAMPVLDGYALIREVRASDVGGSTPIVVLSAHEDSPEALVEEHRLHGYLDKPFEVDQLKELVRRVHAGEEPLIYCRSRT